MFIEMEFRHRGIAYTLSDEWWSEAGMEGFVPAQPSFQAGPSPWPDLAVFQVVFEDVEPLIRRGTHGVFNDNVETGSAHDRVVRILRGFREGSAIPPVEVARVTGSGGSHFKLVHGAHRFYCAVAAGFSHIAAVEVVDLWGKGA